MKLFAAAMSTSESYTPRSVFAITEKEAFPPSAWNTFEYPLSEVSTVSAVSVLSASSCALNA